MYEIKFSKHDDKERPEENDRLMARENSSTGLGAVKGMESNGKVKAPVQNGKSSSHFEKKDFTLFDKFRMSATLFEAVRPPAAVVMYGAEGNMQRPLPCS